MESKLSTNHFRPPLSSNCDTDTDGTYTERDNRSDRDTDSENDLVVIDGRTGARVQALDSMAREEQELDRILMQETQHQSSVLGFMQQPMKNLFSQTHNRLTQPQLEEKEMLMRPKKKQIRKSKKGTQDTESNAYEEVELLFDIEERVFTESSSEAEEKIKISRRRRRGQRKSNLAKKKWRTKYLVSFVAGISIIILLVLFWKLFFKTRNTRPNPITLRSNGTALFAPTTILISLDGFRPDFLNRGITPRLNSMREEGYSPFHMRPSFPSVTFPNHYTLVTGLYPESHGIVSNLFWDEEFKEQFYYTKSEAMDSKWWGGEPIWVTAEKQGVRTAVHMWPGSEAHIMGVKPAFLDKFRYSTTLKEKSSRVLELLDKKGFEDSISEDSRPQLIILYAPHVDIDGHFYGPNSTEIRTTISNTDQMINQIFLGLEQRNLTDIVNIVVVSDHGMATTDIDRMIQLDDLVDLDKIDHIDGWPLSGLRPKKGVDVNMLFKELSQKAALNPNFKVYLRDVNMPERYHYSRNNKIAPLWIVPETGWAIVTREEFNIKESKLKGLQYHPRGLHGFDHEHPLMQSIFIARGPAFSRVPSNRIKPFQNIEVYNIICDSLGVSPTSNNGTLRLPLLPIKSTEADIVNIISDDPENDLITAPPEEQDTSTNTLPLSVISINTISSPKPTQAADIKSPGTTSLSDLYQSLVSGEESKIWDWLGEKSDQLKGWWDKSVSLNKVKVGKHRKD